MCDDRHHGPHDPFNGPHGAYGPKGMYGGFCCSPKDIARMKHMAHRFMGDFMGKWIPYNIEDYEDRYLILVPLPGRTKDDVNVSLLDKHLNISAKKPKIPEVEQKAEKKEEEDVFPFSWKGFSFIDVNMDIPLPLDANEDTITSKMANGLLRVSMEKKPAKSIHINEEGKN